jgi:hypothetical protein
MNFFVMHKKHSAVLWLSTVAAAARMCAVSHVAVNALEAIEKSSRASIDVLLAWTSSPNALIDDTQFADLVRRVNPTKPKPAPKPKRKGITAEEWVRRKKEIEHREILDDFRFRLNAIIADTSAAVEHGDISEADAG